LNDARPKQISFSLSVLRHRIAIAGICLAVLSGCSTTQKTAEASGSGAAPAASTAADAKGILAKGGTTASSTYVDPMVSTGQRRMQAQERSRSDAQSIAAEMPGHPAQASPSIAGLATEPTGVRAGSFSIFSAAQPPASAAGDPVSADVAGNAPNTTGVSAARRSVFSAAPAAACGTDAQGNPLSC
jgi:hypothetical protein